jgi:hypothetical protein
MFSFYSTRGFRDYFPSQQILRGFPKTQKTIIELAKISSTKILGDWTSSTRLTRWNRLVNCWCFERIHKPNSISKHCWRLHLTAAVESPLNCKKLPRSLGKYLHISPYLMVIWWLNRHRIPMKVRLKSHWESPTGLLPQLPHFFGSLCGLNPRCVTGKILHRALEIYVNAY